MRKVILLTGVILLAGGCQEVQVRDRAVKLYRTVPDLFEQQVLDNLALLSSDTMAMPYFCLPSQASEQIARTLQMSYTPSWDFITSGVFVGRYLFDRQSSTLQGTNQNQETFQALPVSDPDKLLLMQAALHRVLGVGDPYQETLSHFFTTHSTWAKYETMVQPGWVTVGKKKDVPHGTCLVGHCGDTYVWVATCNKDNLAGFTLAVLDILTFDGKRPFDVETHEQSTTVEGNEEDAMNAARAKLPKGVNVSNAAFSELGKALKEVIGRRFNSIGEMEDTFNKATRDLSEKNAVPAEVLAAAREWLRNHARLQTQIIRRSTSPGILSPRIIPSVVSPPPTSSPVP